MRRRIPLLLMALALLWPASPARASPRIATDGDPTHPVWYHDTTAVRIGGSLDLAWNDDHAGVDVRSWSVASHTWTAPETRLSSTWLDCGCTDSTHTNPHRHDVPALFADPAGRAYAVYGGGTASRLAPDTGPFFRAATSPGEITSWGPEQRLSVPGSAYDFEAVTDNLGVTHLVGQQGGNPAGAGSLVYLAFAPGTATVPGSFVGSYRTLIEGGSQPACTWLSNPTCDVYVIARLTVGPPNPAAPAQPAALYLVWGWSEKNLSGSCGDPLGCNRGLYFARSLDGGKTWSNATGTVSLSTLQFNQPGFAVVGGSHDVGLFKALAVTGAYPGTPWIAYQPGADLGSGTLVVAHRSGGRWARHSLDSSRNWNNHLVMRSPASGQIYLWSDIAQSGTKSTDLAEWVRSTTGQWSKRFLSVGPNWFLTGTSAGGTHEVLMWRGAAGPTGSRDVAFRLVGIT